MSAYQPHTGLHVYLMGKKTAEAHTRRVYNVKPEHGLGWEPYRVIVMSAGGTLAHTAFVSHRDFKRYLGKSFRLELGRWRYLGFRGGVIKAA